MIWAPGFVSGEDTCSTKYIIFIGDDITLVIIIFVRSLEGAIQSSVREMGNLLHKLKQEQSAPPGAPGAAANAPSTGVRSWAAGAGGAAKQGTGAAAVAQESDYMLRPLMDFLDARLTMFADSCDKTVLKRILKVRLPSALLFSSVLS